MEFNGAVTGARAPQPAAIAPAKIRLMRRNLELPPIPSVAVTLLGLLSKEQVGIAEVSAAIAADAAIAAELLRAANTAHYGIRGEVTSIQHAATLLGLERIRALAATVGLRRYLGQALRMPAVLRCWRHNLACAFGAEQIALRLGGNPADAYTAGLMHDIGRLALVVAHPQAYPAFLDTTTASGMALLDAERALLGIDHCEAGHWFTQQLLLPQVFQDVARHHHDLDAAGPTEMLHRVGVACRLADWLGFWVVAPAGRVPKPDGPDSAAALADLAAVLPVPQRLTLASEAAALAADIVDQVTAFDALLG